jgi:hypothetical protein
VVLTQRDVDAVVDLVGRRRLIRDALGDRFAEITHVPLGFGVGQQLETGPATIVAEQFVDRVFVEDSCLRGRFCVILVAGRTLRIGVSLLGGTGPAQARE